MKKVQIQFTEKAKEKQYNLYRKVQLEFSFSLGGQKNKKIKKIKDAKKRKK